MDLVGGGRLGRLEVILVRAAVSEETTAPGWRAERGSDAEADRPLTEEGRRQAEELADELEPYHLSAVYSSPSRRAKETVEPTARRRGLAVQLLPDLRERVLS